MSSERFTMLVRSASLNSSRSSSDISSRHENASSVSDTETRSPAFLRMFVNSTIFFCMSTGPTFVFSSLRALTGLRSASVEDGLLHRGRSGLGGGGLAGLGLGGLALEQRGELGLRLVDVALVLEDDVEGLVDELLVELLRVEDHQRARPVESLRDRGRLLQV